MLTNFVSWLVKLHHLAPPEWRIKREAVSDEMMAQALAKGIENRLGWEADTTDFDLVCVRCRECFPECGLCFDFYRVVHFSRK